MVAMVVMSLGLLSILHLQVVTVRGHAYARERTQATQIALGVSEEMRHTAQGWLSMRNGTKVAVNSLFPDLVVLPAPPVGDQLDYANLRSVTSYAGQDIAASSAFVDAWKINTFGASIEGGSPPALATGALFRVHYVAHWVDLPAPAPPNSVFRVTVVVSWGNKDHGEGANWTNWHGQINFFKRHMVTKTFYLYRTTTH
jgi:hypothetical protein